MNHPAYKKELLTLLTRFKNRRGLEHFLIDLLTPQEFEEIITRWQIVKQLHQGTPQRDIAKNLSVSISKITRGSRVLLNKQGGFQKKLTHVKK